MKCPHCLVEFHSNTQIRRVNHDVDGEWGISHEVCPNPGCKRLIMCLIKGRWTSGGELRVLLGSAFIRPKGYSRAPLPKEIPDNFADDYKEACLVLTDSPKASAALSRRCLQNLLREVAKVKPGNLADEIQEVIDGHNLPSHLAESIDYIRNVGKFAAHPIKSKTTGEIVAVEPGEAEWNLDVLEALFDFYFVQPAKTKARKAALNAKLVDAGKKPMKEDTSPPC